MKFPCLVRVKLLKIIAIGEFWVQIHMVLADIVYCMLQEDKIFVIVVIVEFGFNTFHIVCFCIVCNT